MSKLRVGVLRGGPSSEHEVSLNTGSVILDQLSDEYIVHDIFIDKQGQWHIGGVEHSPERVRRQLDVAINAMHGEYGEDGRVQQLLEHMGLPYTGARSFPSAIGFNKHLTRDRYAHEGIQIPVGAVFTAGDLEDMHEVFRKVAPISVVKPSAAGSSVGVRITKSYQDLEDALRGALTYGPKAVIEEYVDGREATCGVVEDFRGEELYALPPVEIVPPASPAGGSASFYDYNAKYHSDDTQYVCPGRFSTEEKQEMQRLAQLAHNTLGLRHYSRTDFMIHPRRGIFVLETNTLPGMTTESLFPKSLAAVGTSLPDFLDHLIGLAMKA